MKIAELNSHLSQFYSHLQIIAGRYGRLNQAIAKYFHYPRLRQTRGLPISEQQNSELRLDRSSTFVKPPGMDVSTIDAPNVIADPQAITQPYPVLSSTLPGILQKNSAWRAAAMLPSFAKFSSNQGRFIPFESRVRSQAQKSVSGLPPINSNQTKAASPFNSTPNSADSKPVSTGIPDSGELKKDQVSVSSTAHRLLQVAASFPLLPLALAGSTAGLAPTWIQNSPKSPVGTTMSSQKQDPPIGITPAENASSGITRRIFNIPNLAISTMPVPVALFRNQALSIPLLGLNRTSLSSAFPDVARANRLAQAALPLPAISSQGVTTPALEVGAPQNLSRVFSAYVENETAQTKLRFATKSPPRAVPTTQLPNLKSTDPRVPSYAGANNSASMAAELPPLSSPDIESFPSFTSQPDALPRLSERERRNFELGEDEDQVSMEELRSKISQILLEELRRYLPGD